MDETILNKAYRYYLRGLTSKEIAKLLDVSYRTVQNWMHQQGWKVKRKKEIGNKN